MLPDKKTEQPSAEMLTSIFHNTLHEIGTPLNAVVSASRLLKNEIERGDTEFAHELLEMIVSSSNYLFDIFERVRQVTRQEKLSKFELDEAIFDFRKWINNLLYSLTSLFLEKEITIEKKVADDFPRTIFSDKTYLTQIVYNILMNALKYSPATTTVSVNCFIEEGRCCIAVTDQGIGISALEIPNIFKEYHQVAKDFKSKFGGMGLGLSIAKNLVELMDGHIYVESEVSIGSTFTVSVPLKKFDLTFL
ncbi:phospho-acceptor domain-containing protein [Chitinophaga niastensis]|uniref:histidine kinase n=1 Tax=Chitinophaga niastensis TaxID=536980 RepID=A0A2P8HC23_CHINA|nr:HAMP domain-containing sensor histidine kinase [Chitinophaga niastensis]PSL43795.1 phospho-acceptor domain-containing protein [Chitinophaga niastensis]